MVIIKIKRKELNKFDFKWDLSFIMFNKSWKKKNKINIFLIFFEILLEMVILNINYLVYC